jgi:two-component system response regulator (stage 0 sporulation protein F)
MKSNYVLVVDDYPDVRNMVVTLLSSMGIESRQAVNGAKALELIDEEMPVAIVLDLMMPVMSGFQMLTQLYNRKPHRAVPVILLSGVADDQQMKVLPGVIGVLKKGAFSIEELRNLLLAAVGNKLRDHTPAREVAGSGSTRLV